jgi:hypothetical protein
MTGEEIRRDIYGANARTPIEQSAFNAGYALGMIEGQRIGRRHAWARSAGTASALALGAIVGAVFALLVW